MACSHLPRTASLLAALLLLVSSFSTTQAYVSCEARLYNNINLKGGNMAQAEIDETAPYQQGSYSETIEECCYRCINTYSCTFFTRTPKGLCWLKNALGWSIRAQKDACPDITCTEGLDVGTLHPDDTSEDEAGPVPAASPASGSGRRLRGQPCLACQDATPTQTSSSDEENSTPNTGSGANSGNSSVPNTPTAEPTPAPGNEEEDPAPPTTCQRWVSGNVRNSKLPGYTSYCNIGGDFGDFGR